MELTLKDWLKISGFAPLREDLHSQTSEKKIDFPGLEKKKFRLSPARHKISNFLILGKKIQLSQAK